MTVVVRRPTFAPLRSSRALVATGGAVDDPLGLCQQRREVEPERFREEAEALDQPSEGSAGVDALLAMATRPAVVPPPRVGERAADVDADPVHGLRVQRALEHHEAGARGPPGCCA
jgi:hypothetical protein